MRTKLLHLKSLLIICLLCIVGGTHAWADTYTYTFKSGDIKEKCPQTHTYNNIEWTLTGSISYTNTFDKNKGIQIAKSKGATDLTFTTNDIKGVIKSISIKSCVSSATSSISVSVGGKSWGTKTINNTSITESESFSGNESGEISINFKNDASKKALYLKSITIEWENASSSSVSPPTITPTSQTFSNPFTATIASTTKGATIYYTLDGTDPQTSETRVTYTDEGITIPAKTTTLKACAELNGETSKVVEEVYTFEVATPTITPASQTFSNPFTATIASTAKGATIYYTLDGTDPQTSETRVTYTDEGITIPAKTTTLKACAELNGETSKVVEEVYTYDPTTLVPVWSEDWSSFSTGDEPTKGNNATYICTGSGTKIYNEKHAGGTSPELLIAKSSGSLSINLTNLDGNVENYAFSFKSNKSTFKVTSTTNNVTIGEPTNKDNQYTLSIIVPQNSTELNLTITNTAPKDNMRIDDLLLSAKIETTGNGAFTITPAQYGTYYSEEAFVMPEGVIGYTITAKDNENLTYNEAYAENTIVPAKTALLLKANNKLSKNTEFTFPNVKFEKAAPADNLLHGTIEQAETYVEGATAYYKLANGADGIGFYWGAENGAAFTNGAHKAYLAVSGSLSQMRGFSFNDIVTGIKHVDVTNSVKNNTIYDLNGRRINSMDAATKGIYIVNGKKVIVK